MISDATEPLVRRPDRRRSDPLAVPADPDAAGPPLVRTLARVGSLRVDAVPPHLLSAHQMLAWEKLYEDQPTPSNPFLAPAWVLTWYAHFVRTEDRLVLVVQEDKSSGSGGDVVAVAPMHLHRPQVGPVPVARRMLPVGAGLGQFAFEIPGFLCRASQTAQAARSIVAACLELPVDWAELALTPEQGWMDVQWVQGTEAAMAFSEFVRPRACVVLPLQDSWDATKSSLKRNVKESIRRSANRLAKDGRPVELLRRGADLDQSTVERFLHLHQARSQLSRATEQHHPDAYSDDRNRQLTLDVLPQLGQQGRASMFELYLDGEHVASQLALHSPGTSYVHSSGFREDTWSLGVVTHLQAALIQHAVDRGDSVVNFSPGPNVSKTRWSEDLWVTHEFAFGAGPRSLTPRFAAFQILSTVRSALAVGARHRSQLKAARQ